MTINLSGREFSLIDMHAHFRDRVAYHSENAKAGGFDFVVLEPNTTPCLDNVEAIKNYANKDSAIPFAPMSAITIGREGKQLVDVESIAPHVIGFTDDGNNLEDMIILRDILQTEVSGEGVYVMLHCGVDDPADQWPRYSTEPEWVEKALQVNMNAKGKLYIMHVSRKESVDLIRAAKAGGIRVTAETCPHYFKWTRNTMRVAVNPPIGIAADRDAILEGLSDGTIDIISTDYAPEPRPKGTGIADYRNFINSCVALVRDGVLSEYQLIQKVSTNPGNVIKNSVGYKSGNIILEL
jgi:dihydroorotase